MDNNSKRKFIIIAGIVIAVLFIAWIIFALFSLNQTTITINTSPMRANITINDREYLDQESGSDYRVNKESIQITVHREGFIDRVVSHTVGETKESNILNIALQPNTFEADQLLKSAEESAHRESIVTDDYLELLNTVNEKYPILSDLPYYDRYFVISQGLSQKKPDDPESFALYIDIYDMFAEQGKREAYQFLKNNNYNPDDFEIIFRVEKYQVRSD